MSRQSSETSELGDQRGPLLLQLPPSFPFDPTATEALFELVRAVYTGDFVVEPRHPSWFEESLATLLRRYSMSIAIADPPTLNGAPLQWPGNLTYFRLHGSPRVYYSAYDVARLHELRDC